MSASSTWTVLIVALMQLFSDVISAPVIRAPWGTIRGVEVQGRDDRKMSGYLGIPFALPPTGKLRWQKPQPHPGPGEGKVFEATSLLPACPQEVPWMGVYNGTSEDCLTLNVFVPIGDDVTSGTLKPVMVWIHGGGFRVGDAASYRPTKLVADNDVIVVTIQYRLGVFGFLSTGDATAPGNYGLWDQRLALVWVKDNIRAFGGDPDLVTIFGESAGAISIGIHVISPASNGLFQRAITQSGSPYMQPCFPENYSNKIKELASALGCSSDPGTSFTTMLDCLRGKSVEELIHAETILSQTHNTDFVFMPRVDGELLLDNPGRLMADEVHMALANVGKVDILNGFNDQEGAVMLFFLSLNPVQDMHSVTFFRHVLDTWMSCADLGPASGVASKVLEFFYRGPDAFTNKSVPLDTLVQVYGDALISAPCLAWIRTLADQPHTGGRYLYWLNHDLSFNRAYPVQGTHHGDELLLEFDLISDAMCFTSKRGPLTPEEEKLSSDFVSMLADFAKTGNPSVHLRSSLGEDIPQFTSQGEAYLSLSTNPSIQHHAMRERLAVWLQLLPEVKKSINQLTQQTAQERAKDEL